ncbi:amino acid adenylation domain-containing protein [Actinocrinis puniceicyclus]|uniref:Amino acid adenylation domain-containing protein n=1 Tax=Actinocrinis puniceicyclus TaxID=977794 RepID=A0A8J7WM96_9ACTN|nr:amino acid adenylation domain-containing protein [Actinocrinis puniceicyclus]MBS2962399.1 amino acid adenylation domain-containing protein [Actinocrinis puniceicyclus]
MTDLSDAGSLVELFQAQARQNPGATALVDAARSLSYAELDEASDRLAARLHAAGVRRGDLVGLLLPRCAEIPIAILAALKSGAAYVPLDPDYPGERLRYMVADAGIRTVVGDPDRAKELGLHVQSVDPGQDGAACAPAPAAPLPKVRGCDPAYVIYTSGSTGDPKGCVVSHHNVLSLLRSALPLFDVSGADRWALFHSFSFDVSVWELWAALATGATVVTVPLRVAQSPTAFVTYLAEQRITVLGQVPSVFRALAAAYTEADRPRLSLRYLVFAGESVNLDVIAGFLADYAGGSSPIAVNMYGPTETTVFATHRILSASDLRGPVRSPIGSSLPHLSIELRGPDGAAVPEGGVGEMWVAGDGVSTGYLNRPELTAERFVVDGPGGCLRYYRTGDLARRLADGSFEYLGRDDQQIKLRGFRVELGEIEAALRAHEDVKDAAVTVITTSRGAQFLVACIVPADGAPPNPGPTLRARLGEILPSYMVPDRYKFISELPLTGSGKLDRDELRRVAASRDRAA